MNLLKSRCKKCRRRIHVTQLAWNDYYSHICNNCSKDLEKDTDKDTNNELILDTEERGICEAARWENIAETIKNKGWQCECGAYASGSIDHAPWCPIALAWEEEG